MDPNDISRTAEGMIRNFKGTALEQAEAIALRYKKASDPAAHRLWQAVASEIRSIGRAAIEKGQWGSSEMLVHLGMNRAPQNSDSGTR